MVDNVLPQANGHATLPSEPSSLLSDEHHLLISDSQGPKRDAETAGLEQQDDRDKRPRGAAPIKAEFLIRRDASDVVEARKGRDEADDDAAEAFHHNDRQPHDKRREKKRGQNKARTYGSSRDEVGLCSSRTSQPEFSPAECSYGEKCRFEHDLRKYLTQHKRPDLSTFGGICPVWEVKGKCHMGWKCRFVSSHSQEIERADGRKELVLTEDAERAAQLAAGSTDHEAQPGVINVIDTIERMNLMKRKFRTPKTDLYIPWLEAHAQGAGHQHNRAKEEAKPVAPQVESDTKERDGVVRNSSSPEVMAQADSKQDNRARFADPPLRPSEKRRLYFGRDTPALAPLTTQGNLPYRRLCTSLGASFTYSEMAMSLPLIQGSKSEWALLKGHESEILPPTFTTKAQPQTQNIVYDYNHATDLKLGAQIAASKPWQAIKATEAITTLLPTGLRLVDLNCGCPIDLVYREGAGSALMDAPGKLDKILRGMNAVSGSVPVTVKIRTGTRDKQPTAQKLVDRLILGAEHSRGNPCGVAAITLHGRSRQQRYSKSADWEYIGSTASLIQSLNDRADALADTIHEADARDQANIDSSSTASSRRAKVFFLGNGDIYSHVDYIDHVDHSLVDGVMIGRGALIKPWLFEEIAAGQYLDKSSSERLAYIEKFCRFGLEAWGSDEVGVGQTRRFLLEWLSFACRYIPLGLLERLPPHMNDRPPAYRGRDELETLMASDNYKDWIKISEMFLGPAHKDFHFEPKHKSNSYEAEG